MAPLPQQHLNSYHLALSIILLLLTVYPYLFHSNCCLVAAYSSDQLYLRHNSLDSFDILQSDDIILSKPISRRAVREEEDQLLHPTITNRNNHDDKSYNAIYHTTTVKEPLRRLHFSSLGRRFNLVLGQPANLVTDDLTITTLDGDGRATKIPFNKRDLQVMEGYLDGEARSLALASFSPTTNTLMTAQINTGQETYIVEPTYLHKHELQSDGTSTNAFMAANHTSPYDLQLFDKTMIVYNLRDHKQFNEHDNNGTRRNTETNDNYHNEIFDPEKLCGAVKLAADSNYNDDGNDNKNHKGNRLPRDIEFLYERSTDKTRCTLHLVADYLFYKNVGNGDLQTTINYLLALINRVNLIYLPTVWDTGDDKLATLSNIGFTVQNITIHQEYTRPTSDAWHYNMQSDKVWGARDYLDNFSQNSPPRQYCLAHLLTYRQFDLPVLGLAYVASTRFGTIGGICSPTQQRADKFIKHNTGISTSKGIHGETLITRQADLVLAHELGHNLGAEHDSNECRPSPSNGGAYLMHPFAVMGFEKNNRFLSNCSRLAIGRVIKRKASSCFVGVVNNVCGNGVVEDEEECDGGDVGHGHSDPCCDSTCRFTPGSQCSDRHSWCCSKCHIVPAGRPCRPAEEFNCRQAAYCDGRSAECPAGLPVEDETKCVGRGLCRRGECVPFCEARELHSCLCNTSADACKLCCRQSLNSTCVPYDTKAPYLPDGVLCHKGVCEKGRCEQPIQDVVERLWDVIEDINLTTLGKFLRDNIILVVLVASIPIWCVITHYINEFDARIKRDVITLWNNRRRKALPSRSPFLPRLFVGDSVDDLQSRGGGSLQPLKPPPHTDNIHGQPVLPIGFRLPPGEEIAIEPSGSIAMNSIELPHRTDSNGSSNNKFSNQPQMTDYDLIANGYSTQV